MSTGVQTQTVPAEACACPERAQRLESLGLLAGGIVLDFDRRLTVVMGNVSLARIDPAIDRETRESLVDAERAVARARDLTQPLLTFSKGGAPIRTAVDLADVVREVTEFVIHGSFVRAEFRFEADLRRADVDKRQVGRVVQNLVMNSTQSMSTGGRLDLTLVDEIVDPGPDAILAPGRYLKLAIADRGGRGIDARDLPRISRRGGRAAALAWPPPIRSKRHGGHTTIESTVGAGTTFRIWLPASAATTATSSSLPAVPTATGLQEARRTVGSSGWPTNRRRPVGVYQPPDDAGRAGRIACGGCAAAGADATVSVAARPPAIISSAIVL